MIKALIAAIRTILTLVFLATALSAGLVAYAQPEYRTPAAAMAAVFAIICIVCKPGKLKKKRASSKALYSTLADLAEAAEYGEVKLDATIKAVLRDIRDDLENLSDECEDEAVCDELRDIVYNLTTALRDEPKTEAQSQAHNRRVAAKAEIFNQLKARRA